MEKRVHGFTVHCQILGDEAKGFTLKVITSHPRVAPTEHEWQVPDNRVYATSAEAERQAKYVILGIESVDPNGRPKFSVI